MKIATWNVSGLNAPYKRHVPKCHLNKLLVDIVLL